MAEMLKKPHNVLPIFGSGSQLSTRWQSLARCGESHARSVQFLRFQKRQLASFVKGKNHAETSCVVWTKHTHSSCRFLTAGPRSFRWKELVEPCEGAL